MIPNTNKALVIINDSWGEVDWILPVLFQLKKELNIRIWIYFTSDDVFHESRNYVDLFLILREIAETLLYPSILGKQVALTKKVIQFIARNFYFRIDLIRSIHRIFCLKMERSKLMFSNQELLLLNIGKNVDFLFHDYSGMDFSIYYDYYPKAKNIIFPHGTMIYEKIMPQIKNEIKRISFYNSIRKDAHLIIGSENNLEYFSDITGLENISAIGYPKFDDEWKAKLSISSSSLLDYRKNKKIVLVLLLIPKRKISGENVYESLIEDIVQVSSSFKISLLIKKHPRQNDQEVDFILKKYSCHDIEIANTSALYACMHSDIAVCFPSSCCMDAVAAGIPVIEHFDYMNQFWPTLIRADNETKSIYRDLNLVAATNNRNELFEIISNIINKKYFTDNLLKEQMSALDRFTDEINYNYRDFLT